jgi:formiminoglutamase
MNKDFLSPVKHAVLVHLELQKPSCLGKNMRIHSEEEGFPDLENVQLAIFGVQEDRNSEDNFGCGENLHYIRKKLYELYPGQWQTEIADLGNVLKGNAVTDTYFAVSEIISDLLKKNIIPIIMQQPNNLFNYSNVGYQTYFNDQEEIKLLDNLFFDSYRLGKAKELESIEPAFRNADIVSIDIGAVRQSEAPANNNASPNGFYGEEICAISRYAGISDKVSSFGIYEYNSKYDNNHQTANLIAQIIWYFIEGVNFRVKDYPFSGKENYQKFTVLMENDDSLIFYKSNKTGRWWIEINILSDNKYKRHALIPCTYNDYKEATKQNIPERWYKAMRKML